MKRKLINYICTVTMMVAGILSWNVSVVYAIDDSNARENKFEGENIEPDFNNLYWDIHNQINVTEEEKHEEMIIEYKEKLAEEARRKKEREEREQALLKSMGLKSKNRIEFKIYKACEKYHVPFSIVLAIARLETGWFTSDAYLYRNNPGGLSRNEVPLSFSSKDVGVDRFVKNLKENYFDEGLDTPYEIGQKYCPVNPDWANMVSRLMEYPVGME
mgnify:FL=1